MNDKINEFMIWAEDKGWTITTNIRKSLMIIWNF